MLVRASTKPNLFSDFLTEFRSLSCAAQFTRAAQKTAVGCGVFYVNYLVLFTDA